MKPTLGFLALTSGFDPLKKTGGVYDYLAFAKAMASATDRFTRISYPVVPNEEWVELGLAITETTGLSIVPVWMGDEEHNPADPLSEAAAIEHFARLAEYSLKVKATQGMGPSGEPWQPGAKKWGPPADAAEMVRRIEQAAKVHAEALQVIPDDDPFTFATEFLFDGEQVTFNTPAASALLARRTNALLGRTRLTVTLDTAHRYQPRKYEGAELEKILAADAALVAEGIIGLCHISRPRRRSHPLRGAYPLEAHVLNLVRAGYTGPIDVELFPEKDPFLLANLPGYDGEDAGFSDTDPVTPHIETAAQLDAWFSR